MEEYKKNNLVTITPLVLDNITRDGTSRDFEAMLDEFKKVFPKILPEYSSLEDDDYGVAIVQFILWMLDNLNYQLDFYIQQRTRRWCRNRRALFDILEWFSYFIPSASPAKCSDFKFYLSSFPVGYTDGIVIPKATKVKTNVEINGEYVIYETDSEVTLDKQFLTADATDTNEVYVADVSNYYIGCLCEIKDDDSNRMTARITAIETSLKKLVFDTVIPSYYTVSKNAYVAMLEVLSSITQGISYTDNAVISQGRPFEEFTTQRNNVIDDTLTLWVDGIQWTKVKTVLYSEPSDKVFEISKTVDHKVICRCGDGYAGSIIPANSSVVLKYRVGGGRSGNVGKNVITDMIDTITYHGSTVSISCINLSATKHGGEQMTVERAKIIGPASIFALDRAVTAEDFEALVENYVGVSRATVSKYLDKVGIYVVGNGVTTLSKTEKQAILDYLKDRRIGGDGIISIYDPTFVSINMKIQIKMSDKVSIKFETIKPVIISEIQQFFDPDYNSKIDFGKTGSEQGNIFISDIYTIADDEDKGVEYALIPEFTISPLVRYSGSWPSDSTVKDVSITSNTVTETWRIMCIGKQSGKNLFEVRGSVSGIQSQFAEEGVEFHSDNDEVIFTIENSSTGFNAGDSATIKVMKIKNEYISLDDAEFPIIGSLTIEEIE